ncbi:MAG: proton-conducting transporter membrane subunit [Acidobacteriota bacterium]
MTLPVLLPIALPLITAVLVGLLGESRRALRETVTLVMSVLTFASVLRLYDAVRGGERFAREIVTMMPGVPVRFEIEPIGLLYALVASGLWGLTSLYAIGYLRGKGEANQTRFFVCFSLSISAALGIAFAGNLLTLFIFYEVLTLVTFPLVTHHGTLKAQRAGRVYLGLLMTTSVCLLLPAILWTYQLTGTLDFRLGGILAGHVDDTRTVGLLLLLFAFGTGKAALMPLHRWLPNAMVAPTPVSALLHAVAVVKAGVFTVLKIVVYVFGVDFLHDTRASDVLLVIASFTIIAGSLRALQEDNLKARLAYSTVSQLAYIIFGAALATQAGVLGAGVHIAVHAMGKITLFFCAGAIYVATNKTLVSQLDGLGRTMPWTFGAFFLGAASIVGVPPFSMWSKFDLGLGTTDGRHEIFLAVLMLSSLLNIAYLMPIPARAFFMPRPETDKPAGSAASATALDLERPERAPLACVLPLCVTAFGCLVLFFSGKAIDSLIMPLLGGSL